MRASNVFCHHRSRNPPRLNNARLIIKCGETALILPRRRVRVHPLFRVYHTRRPSTQYAPALIRNYSSCLRSSRGERAALVVVLFLVVRGRSCLLYVRAGARIDQSEPTQAREMSVTLATRHKNSPENLLLTRARFLRQQYKRKVSKKRAKMYITHGIIHRTATLRI